MPTILRHLIHDTMIHPHFNTDSVGDQALVSDNYSWELLVANMKVWKRAERQKVEDLFSTLCTFASKELDLSHIFSTVIFANLKRENILRMQQHMLGWTDPVSFGNMLQDATMSAWADWTGGWFGNMLLLKRPQSRACSSLLQDIGPRCSLQCFKKIASQIQIFQRKHSQENLPKVSSDVQHNIYEFLQLRQIFWLRI